MTSATRLSSLAVDRGMFTLCASLKRIANHPQQRPYSEVPQLCSRDFSAHGCLDRCPEGAGSKGFGDPGVGTGSAGEEGVGLAIQQQDHGHTLGARPEVASYGHASHRADLEVDDGDIDRLLGRPVGGGAGVVVVDQLVSDDAQSGVDAIAVVGVIGDDEDPGHGGTVAEWSGPAMWRLGRIPYSVSRITYHLTNSEHLRTTDYGLRTTFSYVIRRIILLAAALTAVLTGAAVSAAQTDDLPVVVIEVKKPMDQRLMDFVADTVGGTDAHLFVIQLDSPGISSGGPGDMYEAIATASAPVAVWVGDRPAAAFGGAASLLNVSDIGAAAPGTEIGYLEPTVVTNRDVTVPYRPSHDADGDESTEAMRDTTVVVTDPIPGYVDIVVPTIGQLIVGLDGTTVVRGEGESATTFEISTASLETTPDGIEVMTPNRLVQFVKPSLWDRFLRLASRPEVAFFFLVVAIAAATFEFYAAGPGITAAVAVTAFVLAGYGLATLPTFWPGVAAAVAGLLFYTWDFQRNRVGWRSAAGTAFLIGGGLAFTNARPQFAPSWWIVLMVVAGTALFYAVGLTTIVKSRFSTPTIGRDHLIGRTGVADEALSPDGVVLVDGARWRARSHREAGIGSGDGIEVQGIDGVVLLVDRDESLVDEGPDSDPD